MSRHPEPEDPRARYGRDPDPWGRDDEAVVWEVADNEVRARSRVLLDPSVVDRSWGESSDDEADGDA